MEQTKEGKEGKKPQDISSPFLIFLFGLGNTLFSTHLFIPNNALSHPPQTPLTSVNELTRRNVIRVQLLPLSFSLDVLIIVLTARGLGVERMKEFCSFRKFFHEIADHRHGMILGVNDAIQKVRLPQLGLHERTEFSEFVKNMILRFYRFGRWQQTNLGRRDEAQSSVASLNIVFVVEREEK